MANTVILGQVRPVNKGPWSATVTYTVMQRVTYNAVLWEAQKDVPMGAIPEKDSEYWFPISAMDVEEIPVDEFVNTTSDQVIGGKKDFSGEVLLKTPAEGDDSRRAANTKYVQGELTKKADDDAVVKLAGDQVIEGKKDFHGEVTVPTLPNTDNSNKAASTAYVQEVLGSISNVSGDSFVNIAGNQIITGNKQFTGEVTVQTPPVADNSQKIANTAFVQSLIEQTGGAGGEGVVTLVGTQTITGNKTFDGQTLVSTQPTGDSTRKAASTAFVQDAITQELYSFRTSTIAAESAASAAQIAADAASAAATTAQNEVDNCLPLDGSRNMTGRANWQGSDIDRDVNPEAAQFLGLLGAKDKNGKELLNIYTAQRVNGDQMMDFGLLTTGANGEQVKGGFTVNTQRDGRSYLNASSPQDLAAPGMLINRQFAQNNLVYSLPATKDIHVFGSNASDTQNLFAGRGDSADAPFASIHGALNFAQAHYSGAGTVNLILHDDYEFTSAARFNCCPLTTVIIKSDATTRKIKFAQGMYLYGGLLAFSGIDLELGAGLHAYSNELWCCLELTGNINITCLPGCNCAVAATWPLSKVYIGSSGSLTVNGQVSAATVVVNCGGIVLTNKTVQGNVTGKRYQASSGGLLVATTTNFPGTEAGTCDASSTITG